MLRLDQRLSIYFLKKFANFKFQIHFNLKLQIIGFVILIIVIVIFILLITQ